MYDFVLDSASISDENDKIRLVSWIFMIYYSAIVLTWAENCDTPTDSEHDFHFFSDSKYLIINGVNVHGTPRFAQSNFRERKRNNNHLSIWLQSGNIWSRARKKIII